MVENVNFNINLSGASGESEPTPQEQDQQQATPNVENPATPISSTRSAIAAQIGVNAAKQIATRVTSNIGEWTGNNYYQTKINNMTKIAGYGMMIAVDPTPFKIASLSTIGIQAGFDIAEYYVDRKWQKQEYERSIARMGLGSFRNR